MLFRKLFGLFLIGILLFGVFGALGRGRQSRYESAWLQGFVAGQQAAAGDGKQANTGDEADAAFAPNPFPDAQRTHHGPGFGAFLLPFFLIGAGFMLLGRRRRWHAGHSRGPWACGDREQHAPKEKSPDDIDDGPTMKA